MKNLLKTTLIAALICLPQVGYALQQPPVTPTPSLAKKVLTYAGKGLRFALKGTDRVVGLGLMGMGATIHLKRLHTLNTAPDVDVQVVTNDTGIPRDIRKLQERLCNKMGIDGKVHLSKYLGDHLPEGTSAAASYVRNENLVGLNKDFFQLPPDQQEAILAHELTHVKYKDMYHNQIVQATAPLGALVVGSTLSHILKKTYAPSAFHKGKASPFASRLMGRTIPAVLSSAVLQWGVGKLSACQYNRYYEKRADLEAAAVTGKAQSLINYLTDWDHKTNQRIADTNKVFHEEYITGKVKQQRTAMRLPDLTHPTVNQRIAYLKPYTQPQQVVPEREYNDLPISC